MATAPTSWQPDSESADESADSTVAVPQPQAEDKVKKTQTFNRKTGKWRKFVPLTAPGGSEPEPTQHNTEIPLATASILSQFLFLWISPILRLGFLRPLQIDDLWKLDESRSSKVLGAAFLQAVDRRFEQDKIWNARLQSGEFKPSFLRKHIWWPFKSFFGFGNKDGTARPGIFMALYDILGREYMFAGVLKVFSDVITTTQPLVTKALINFGMAAYLAHRGVPEHHEQSIGRGVGLVIGLFLMLIAASLLLNQFFSRSSSTGVLARGALIASIYRVSMELSGKARTTLPNSRIITLISADVSRIDFASGFAHIAWTGVIQLIVILVILLVNLGASALAGFGFMIFMTPLQVKAMKSMFKLRSKVVKWTDKRAKLTQELLGGIKIIKLFSWEVPYLQKLYGYRASELRLLRNLLVLRAGAMAVAMSLPVLATVISFVTYSATGHNQDPAVIFTSFTLFNLLRMPLLMLPLALGSITDAAAAMKRIAEVFVAERSSYHVEYVQDEANAIEVADASFKWESAAPEVLTKKEAKKAQAKQDKKDKAEAKAQSKADRKHKKSDPASRRNTPEQNEKAGDFAAGSNDPKEGRSALDSSERIGVQELDEKAVEHPGDAEDVLQLSNINVKIPKGKLVAVVGSVGAGKTSFLSALIGEMKRTAGSVRLGGKISYCAQTAWIQNATLRENILFGQEFDQERYWAAISDACLEPDLAILPDGDLTEIGEKGINLSGGQRQRVGIARALYYPADIVVLDDPLSAVDAHVGNYLFEHAIQGALAGRTRLLVTHALHFLPRVDRIIVIDHGRITEEGTYEELIAQGGAFSDLVQDFGGQQQAQVEKQDAEEEEAIEQEDPEEKKQEATKPARKLMQEEERALGSVSFKVVVQFLKAGHGAYMVPLCILALALNQGASVVGSYWLVWWSEDNFNQSRSFYEGLYAALGVSQAIFGFLMGAAMAILGYLASGSLHNKAAKRVLLAPMSLFDTTPLGRIINRFTKDMDTIDNQLNDSMRMGASTLAQVVGAIVLIAIVNQYFLIAVAVILVFYYRAAYFYRSSAREIKRLDNLLRSSLYAHFSESLTGLSTIRSFGEGDRFLRYNEDLVDRENCAYLLTVYNQRWLGVRLDFFGSILALVVAIISVVTRHSISPSQTGLILSYILLVQSSFTWMVRQVAEVENDMTSTERMLHYATELEQEAPSEKPETKPPATWPSQGAIEIKDLVMQYRPGLPVVLKGISVSIQAGQKVGIVGRTGSGKTSILVSLLRLVEPLEGSITIDGIDVATIGLGDLRRAIAIIPQEALLFNGTIRSNLDPFSQYDDQRLWDALRRAWLVEGTTPGETKASRFTLDTAIEDEGSNLSVGERSLVSLARALVKDSKIVVLDEATASVDYSTDSKIQETIRSEFADKTLLCIAHRLRTILSYDRVLVLDQGEVVEFDTPANLFAQAGIFHGMCQRSNITAEDIQGAQG